jgi:hypothetical protein
VIRSLGKAVRETVKNIFLYLEADFKQHETLGQGQILPVQGLFPCRFMVHTHSAGHTDYGDDIRTLIEL